MTNNDILITVREKEEVDSSYTDSYYIDSSNPNRYLGSNEYLIYDDACTMPRHRSSHVRYDSSTPSVL